MKLKSKNYILLFIGIFALVAAMVFRTMYSTITIGQSIYHLKVPLEGTNLQVFVAFLNRCLPITIICFIFIFFLFKEYKVKAKYIKIKTRKIQIFPLNYLTKYSNIFSIILILICFISLSFYLDIGTYLKNQFVNTNLYEDYYVDSNSVDINFPDKKRNLIYIYVESLENTYSSTDKGGNQDEDIMPELSSLALNNLNFSNTNLLGGAYQVGNTDWTAAALVAQTSGLPLNLSLTSESYETDDYFFPEVSTLGDILNDNGYTNVFMLGSNANFGGRKSYFINHGNYKILDLEEMKNQGILDEDYYVWWGFEDNKLYTFAKEELTNLSKKDEPFNFTMLTADTHFVDGYLEEGCEEKYHNNISNVVACTSKLLNNFIEWIQDQDFYDNTTIVISGDHLYMDSYYLNSNDYTRTIYNTFINSSIDTTNNHNRIFSTLDMFPTTLASLGVRIDGDRLGLGTNLFSNKKTILETIGFDKFNQEVLKESELYNKLLGNEKQIEN